MTEDVSGTIGDSSGMNMPGVLVSSSGTNKELSGTDGGSSGMNMPRALMSSSGTNKVLSGTEKIEPGVHVRKDRTADCRLDVC